MSPQPISPNHERSLNLATANAKKKLNYNPESLNVANGGK